MRRTIGWLLLLILATPVGAFAADYVVIVNAQNAVHSISPKDLSLIFLKKNTRWPNGQKIELIALPDTTPASIRFDKEIFKRSPAAIRAYWQQEIFSGRSVPPVEKTTDEEIVAFVASNPGAIGYVAVAPSKAGVKVIKVEE
jgi:ABC-type phosphate transport system substrate-binding protein